jgi:L-malate glycosyltransferase
MNILFLVSSLEFGGAERQTVLDANLLSSEHRVFLGYYDDGGLEKLVSANVTLIKIMKTGYPATAFRILKVVRINRIQLIHASLFSSMVLASLVSIGWKVKVIWHFHSHEFDLPLRSRIAFHWLAKLPAVRKILFVNHELMEHFNPYNFPSSKKRVLYNHSELSLADPMIRNRKDKTVNIGYIGRVVAIKRVHYLVELASFFISRQLPEFKIHIVGDGDELTHLKELTAEQGLNGSIVFYGYQTDVASLYKQFDLFVNPSSEECLSIAMIDAGMMALPIVAFDVGGNNEIVLENRTGFIVKSKDDFLNKCSALAYDEKLRTEMGWNAWTYCREQFSKERHLEEISAVYKEVMSC